MFVVARVLVAVTVEVVDEEVGVFEEETEGVAVASGDCPSHAQTQNN